jgi:CheY-like chemotaxis protein
LAVGNTAAALVGAFLLRRRPGFRGNIEVESEPDRGTQFRIYLPQTAAAPDPVNVASSPVVPAGGRETILLAEDEAGIRAMTKTDLESLGYNVIEASDGTEAVRISGEYQDPIDVVLTDVVMPGLRGDAAVSTILQHRAGTKVLYISGYSEEHTANDAGNVLYIPFEFPELGRRVRSVLDSDSGPQNQGAD